MPGDELRQDHLILVQTVVLQFKIIVAFAKQVAVVQRRLLGALVITGQNRLGHLARQAGGKTDQPLMVLFQQFFINARLGIESFQESSRNHLDQVPVTSLVLAQQDQVAVAVDPVDFVKAGAGRHIDLAADDRLDARRLGRIKKSHAAIHDAVVRDRACRLAHRFQMVEHAVDPAGAIQQAVFGMHMQMGELSLRRFRHCFDPFLLGARPAGCGPLPGYV